MPRRQWSHLPSTAACALVLAYVHPARREGRTKRSVAMAARIRLTTRERDLTVLLDATRLLADSLDLETTLATVARLSLPHLGSWCVVDLREGDLMRRLAIIHPDPSRQSLADRLRDGWPPHEDDAMGLPSALQMRRSHVVRAVTDDMLVAAARSPENLAILRELEIGSYMTIPLLARGHVLGAVTYVSPNHGDSFSELDLALAEDLAARVAIAIDHAHVMRESTRALAAAELSEQRFARIISIAAEAIISIDDVQRVVLFNAGAEHIFGYSKDEIIGQSLDLLLPEHARGVHPSHVRGFGDSSDVARRMGQRHAISGRRKSGEEFPAEASISKLDVGGARIYTVVLRDITEQRNAKLAQQRLLDAVTEATEARGRLIRGVTHDVKNPLGAADGYAQLLELELEGTLAPEALKLVAGVRRGIRGALAMVTDLLDLSRAESGGLSVHRQPVELWQVVIDALEDEHGAAESAGHTLCTARVEHDRPDRAPVLVHTDAHRVREVLANLLSNAVKYTPAPGRITAWAEMVPPGSTPRRGAWAAIHVRDSGPGVPIAERERIFGEFHRLHTAEQATGHGLGLAISRRIAQLLGGDLTVDGPTDEGAVFTLWLPADEAAA